METEGNNNEQEMFQNLSKHIVEIRKIVEMCANAPKDQNGNAVVSVVGIKNFGMFYLYEN